MGSRSESGRRPRFRDSVRAMVRARDKVARFEHIYWRMAPTGGSHLPIGSCRRVGSRGQWRIGVKVRSKVSQGRIRGQGTRGSGSGPIEAAGKGTAGPTFTPYSPLYPSYYPTRPSCCAPPARPACLS